MKNFYNKKLKKWSAFALSLILVSMTGCKSNHLQETVNRKQNSAELADYSEYGYKTEFIDIKKRANEISEPVLSGDTLYFFNITGEREGPAFWQLQSVHLSAPEEIKTYDSFFKEENFIQKLEFPHANKDGGITFLQVLYPKDEENFEKDSIYRLIRLDADGTVLFNSDVTHYFKNQISLYGVYTGEDAAKFLYIYSQPMPGSKNISEQESHFMLIINCETGEGEKTAIDCEPSLLTALYSGDVMAVIYDTHTGKNFIKVWDKDKNTFSDKTIDFSKHTFHQIYPAYEDKFYYINSVTGILSLYDLSEQNVEQTVRLMDWNIPDLAVSLVSCIDSNHMIVVGGSNAIYRMTRVKASEIKQKTEIILGCMDSFKDAELIAEFNRKHSDYQITVKNYISKTDEQETVDSNEAVSLLTKDILTGNAPDLIDLSGIDYARYSGSGMFEDLYPYIHKDEDLQNRNLNQNILKLFEEDGELYALPSKYTIHALGSEKQTLENEAFTLDKYLEIASDNTEKSRFQRIGREKLLSTLFAYNEDYLIDYKAKTCNFTDGIFEKILTIAKEHKSAKNEDAILNESSELPKLAADKQILFYPMDFYDIVSEYQCVEKMFDNQFHITGYPSVTGDKTAVTVTENLYAISSLSQHKDICWEFIKLTFDFSNEKSEFQRSSSFPVDNDLLENYFQELKSEDMGYYENGQKIPVANINNVWIYAPTEDEIQKIRELIYHVNTLIPDSYTGDIYKILAEEAEGFYANDKTAKEVCKVIQSRVNLLINEN